MTANVLAEDRDRCVASGMDDHLSKPITRASLERALSLWTTAADPLPRAESTTVG